jgi:hypothetical protein
LDPLASAPSAATGAAPPGATISNADLIAQLQARQEAKARRDFATADAIRFALERQHRVKVYDTTKSWIANDGRKGNTVGPNFFSLDGTSFAAGNQAPPGVRPGAPPTPYVAQSAYPPAVNPLAAHPPYGGGYPVGGYPTTGPAYPPAPPGMLTMEAIFSKLAEREDARRKRDDPRSDPIDL